MEDNLNKRRALPDKQISIVCIALVAIFVLLTCINPDGTLAVVSKAFDVVTAVMAEPMLWFVLIGLFVCLYLAFSKHGNVKLGEGDPEYSTFSYIGMMICASLAATAIFYSFVEWSYYLSAPAFSIEPYSQEAAEFAMPYTFFHWGLGPQVIFGLAAVSIAYAYYVKGVPVLRVGAVCEEMMGDVKYKRPLARVIDAITIMSIVGGMGVSLGVGIPLITAGLGQLFGMQANFTTNVIVLLIIAVIFTLSSFVGIKKGMKRVSDVTMYLAILLVAFIFVAGPTSFIWKELTYSLGKMFQNYIDMSLFTDPIGNSGFAESNTIFIWTLSLNYAALMGIFITKVSKGRTIRQMMLACLIGISFGCVIMFGINGGFGLNAELQGIFELSKAEDTNAGLFMLLGTLPGGKVIIPIAFTLITIGLLVTSLDSASFTISVAATKQLDENGDPKPTFKVIWCLVLTLVPLSLMFAGAPFTAVKTVSIVLSVPFFFIIIGMLYGLFKWFKEDGN